MKILAIDPGLRITGFSIIQHQVSGQTHLLSCGFLPLKNTESVAERINHFYTFFNSIIKDQQITAIALEKPFLGKNVDSFLKLGYLRGMVHLLSAQHSIGLYEFFPVQVKIAVTGFGKADKEQIARAITHLFPMVPPGQKSDVTDAIAIGLCCAWRSTSYSK